MYNLSIDLSHSTPQRYKINFQNLKKKKRKSKQKIFKNYLHNKQTQYLKRIFYSLHLLEVLLYAQHSNYHIQRRQYHCQNSHISVFSLPLVSYLVYADCFHLSFMCKAKCLSERRGGAQCLTCDKKRKGRCASNCKRL